MVLPAPFGPTMPMRSPRWTRIEKSSTITRSPNALAMSLASITSLPDLLGFRRGEIGGARRAAIVAALVAQRVQIAEPLDVALAPAARRRSAASAPRRRSCGRACAGRALLPPEPRRARPRTRQSRDRSAVIRPRSSQAVRARQVGEEAAVMADQHQRAAPAVELVFQPFDGRRDRDGWSARPAAGCRARAPARAPARRGAPRRRRGSRDARRR